jgi:hypothetical protein
MTEITKKRKVVTTFANRFYGTIKDRPCAFEKAWEIVKDDRPLGSRVAGVSFGNRQRALIKLEKYEPDSIAVTLTREADNKHDTNAIKVLVNIQNRDKYHLGYLPGKMASLLAPLIDKGFEPAVSFHLLLPTLRGRGLSASHDRKK